MIDLQRQMAEGDAKSSKVMAKTNPTSEKHRCSFLLVDKEKVKVPIIISFIYIYIMVMMFHQKLFMLVSLILSETVP